MYTEGLGGVNEPMALGFNGISHSTSTLNESVITLMNKLGLRSRLRIGRSILGGTPISDALLGIKYVITKNDKLDPNLYTVAASAPEYYEYVPSYNTIYAMQNTKALSIAYGVSPELSTKTAGYPASAVLFVARSRRRKPVNAMLSGAIDTPSGAAGALYSKHESVGCTYHAYAHTHTYTERERRNAAGGIRITMS